MKGLLLENFYKQFKSTALLLLIIIVLGIAIGLFIDEQLFIFIYLALIIISISTHTLLLHKRDYDLKLYQQEMLLPLNPKVIVSSKYISFIIGVLLSSIIAILFVYFSSLFGKNYFDYGLSDTYTLLILVLSFNLHLCAFYYTGVYCIDLEKTDIWLVAGLMGSVLALAIEILIIRKFHISKETGNIILIGFTIAIFTLSYIISAKSFTHACKH